MNHRPDCQTLQTLSFWTWYPRDHVVCVYIDTTSQEFVHCKTIWIRGRTRRTDRTRPKMEYPHRVRNPHRARPRSPRRSARLCLVSACLSVNAWTLPLKAPKVNIMWRESGPCDSSRSSCPSVHRRTAPIQAQSSAMSAVGDYTSTEAPVGPTLRYF